MRPRCPSEHRLLQVVDGDLPLEERFELNEHLERCSRCRARQARHLRLDEALLSLPAPELGEADRRRLLAGIHEARQRPRTAASPRSLPQPRPALAGWRRAAAAALLLASPLLVWFGRSVLWKPEQPAASTTRFSIADSSANSSGASASSAETDAGAGTEAVGTEPAGATPSRTGDRPLRALEDPELAAELSRGRHEMARVRAEVLEWLRALPRSGPLPSPTLREFSSGGRPPATVLASLESLLEHEETPVGRNAARVLAQALDEDTAPLASPGMVATLERALGREDRAAYAFFVLRRIEQPHLQAMIGRVIERAAERNPSVRRSALMELALRFERGDSVDLERVLLRLLRSEDPEDRELLAEVLARASYESERALQTLHSLYAEGAPRGLLAPAVERLGAEAVEAIARSLHESGPFELRVALDLAGLGRQPSLVEHVLPLARAGRQAARAVDTLAAIGGVQGHAALLELLSGPSLSRSRHRVVQEALVRSLRRADSPAELVRNMARRGGAAGWPQLLDVVAQLGTATSAEACLALASDPELSGPRRATAGVLAAMRDPGLDPAELLAVLQEERDRATSPALSALSSAMLVSLHVLDEERGLEQGLELLQVRLDSRRRAQLSHLAAESARDLNGPRFERDLRRIGEVVAGG